MKKILSFLFVIIGLLGYSQDEYYRKVDWKFYPENVIQLTDSTYLTDAYPFDYNDVGAIQRVVGNYVVDFVGHRYEVIDSTTTTITVLDIYHIGQAPQTGQIARCYRSVGDGEAEYIGSIDYSPLDESSRWKLNGSDNELLWRQTIGKAENGLYKDFRTVKLGGNLIEPTTINQDNNSFKILNNGHGSVFSETGIAYTKIDTVDFTDSTLVTKMYVKSLIKEGTDHDSLTIAPGSVDYFEVIYPQIFSGQKLIDTLGVMNTKITGKEPILTKGNLTAGSSKVTIGGTGTNALIGAGASVDINEVNLTLSNLGGSVTDSQVPNTITLDNITQITNRSHTNLSNIGTNTHTQIDTFIASKGQNNGVATLDTGGKVPFSQLPASLMIYKGTWSPLTNTPTLADGIGTSGWVYKASLSGSVNLGSGIISFYAGDWVIYNGTTWERSVGTDNVVSVNGQQGIVSLNTSHIPENTNLYYTDSRTRAAISLTTTGNSGASTYGNSTGIFNIPTYTLSGLGGEPAFSKNTAFNKNFGTTTGTVLEGRTFGTAANSNVTDFAPASGSANYVRDYGAFYNGLIYDIPSKTVFSGFSLADAPGPGWVSGLVLGDNWNNNHYQKYLVFGGTELFLGDSQDPPVWRKIWHSGNSNTSTVPWDASQYKLSGVDLYSSLTANTLQKWDGTKHTSITNSPGYLYNDGTNMSWIKTSPQSLSGTTPTLNASNGVNANLSISGATTLTLSNLISGTSGAIYLTNNASVYRIKIAGYTIAPASNITYDSTGILLPASSIYSRTSIGWYYNGTTVQIHKADYNTTTY